VNTILFGQAHVSKMTSPCAYLGRREVQTNIAMSAQKFGDALGLVRRQIVDDDLNVFALRLVGHDVGRERHELGGVWRAAVLPSTSPVLVLKAAYNDSVPWR